MSSAPAVKSLKDLLAGAQLPALPQSAIRLLELSQDPNKSPTEFATPIEADPGHGPAFETRRQAAKGVGVLVDHGYRVPSGFQDLGERRADPPAAHDDDVHGAPSVSWAAEPPSRRPPNDVTRATSTCWT